MLSGYGDVSAVLDRLNGALDRLMEPHEGLTAEERFALRERFERTGRQIWALQNMLINSLRDASPAELGGELSQVLADRLGISRREAVRRIAEAAADAQQ